jgi:two-component system, OmpR family, KDP operon response regulator KdpE
MKRILVIDDEPQIRRFLQLALETETYEVLLAENGQTGLNLAVLETPDLIVLDLGLPDISGLDLLTEIRQWSQTPIIILSVQSQETQKVKALDLGANDYLTKPFGVQELLARIRNALRHSERQHLEVNGADKVVLSLGNLKLDRQARTLHKDNLPIKLTKTEFNFLALLMEHQGTVLTHPHILRKLWGPEFINDTHYLQVYVSQIRKKIEVDPTLPQILITEPGIGYRLG